MRVMFSLYLVLTIGPRERPRFPTDDGDFVRRLDCETELCESIRTCTRFPRVYGLPTRPRNFDTT